MAETAARRVQAIYRVGLALGAGLILAGWIWALVREQTAVVSPRLGALLTTGSIADRAVGLGVLFLAVTPVAVVIDLVGSWWREGDRRFALVGAMVIAVLVLAVSFGHG